MAEIDLLNSGNVIIRTGSKASARFISKKDDKATRQLEIVVNPGETTAKELESMLHKLKIEYLSDDQIEAAAGKNGVFEESELTGLDAIVEKSRALSELRHAGVDIDSGIIKTLSPKWACNTFYIEILKDIARSGKKLTPAIIWLMEEEDLCNAHYVQVVKDLYKYNSKSDYFNQFISALNPKKVTDEQYIASLIELGKEGIIINSGLIGWLTPEKAYDPDYLNALIRMSKEGIRIDGDLISYLTQEQSRDFAYISLLIGLCNIGVVVDFRVLGILDQDRGFVNLSLLIELRKMGVGLNPNLLVALKNIHGTMRDPEYWIALSKLRQQGITQNCFNIDFPERFIEDLPEILTNRMNVGKRDARPLALLIYPKGDAGVVFMNNQIHELIKRGYKVVYYEVSRDTEFLRAVREAGTAQKISLFVIAGHGARTETNFSEIDPGSKGEGANECHYLDIGDGQKLVGLSNYMEDGSTIILESCSTGEGGKKARNMANMIKKAFPNSTVFAPKTGTKVNSYKYDTNNRVIDVNYECGQEKTYSIK